MEMASSGLSRRQFAVGASSALLNASFASAASPMRWPNNAKAAVSLNYDDGYDSQLENVGPALDRYGFKATFFLTVENIDERVAEWKTLVSGGHEIGDHTMTHPCELADYSSASFVNEQIVPAERYLDEKFGGPKPRGFAFPCGEQKLGGGADPARLSRYAEILPPLFYGARTVYGGPNNPAEVLQKRYALSAYVPTNQPDADTILDYVAKAIAQGHWAIIVFHEVVRQPKGPWDTARTVHDAVLKRLAAMPVWCAPVRDVFNHVTGEI